MNDGRPGTGSLLEGIDAGAPRARGPGVLARRRAALDARARAWARGAWAHPASRAMVVASALMLTASGALAAWLTLRPVPKPDYEAGRLDTLFNYTLLTDEFNGLPIEERVELIGQLVSRVRGMDGSESVLMAAFAAQIAGPARDQLVENASKVMVDLTDRAAEGYDRSASRADRVAYVEQAAVDLVIAMRTMGGEEVTESREEILADAREQARRDAEIARDALTPEAAGQMTTFLARTMGMNSSAQQKLRMGVFGRDMARTLRGEDIDTGRRLPAP